MAKLNNVIQTAQHVVPMIYAYSTPGIEYHIGWTKIGYTEQDVDTRINQQTHTAGIKWKKEWQGTAIFDDGSGDTFRDTDFHQYLRKLDFENEPKTEWFHIDGPTSRGHFFDFKENHGLVGSQNEPTPYILRAEQEDAVNQTLIFRDNHEDGEFLWNAKPRFGKTLSVYDFCVKSGAQNVLIVTNRPAIANSWYSDYEKFLGTQSGYRFVSNTDSLRGKPLVLSRDDYLRVMLDGGPVKCIEFVSLQDLKGSIYFGGDFDKLSEVKDMQWDILVIDEAHEGVDTYKTDVAFDHIKRKFTLHLSGTPFKALANEKFANDAIFNWTYADEQKAKRDWPEENEAENPYANLPRLSLLTYQMSEVVKDELQQGIEINGETEEYAFDLNEFFAVNNMGAFIYDSSVDKFLDALTTLEKYPFSTPELRAELKHTFWLLNRVDSAKALARKLKEHPVFSEYEIVLAAGDGRIDDADEVQKSFDKVKNAIETHEKTITLSVGQLTTGVTIPEWSAVVMLSNMRSPALYMQAAFRAQNPCMFSENGQFYRKENAYVFDFDPARTLTIFEEFANDLSGDTAAGKGDSDTRKEHVRELLNFFPVIGEDENGEMVELDAEKVLSIPRKIRSQEVVRRGFMSNFLFQNIANIFSAPKEVVDILTKFTPTKEPSPTSTIDNTTKNQLSIDDNGEIVIQDEKVAEEVNQILGNMIYAPIDDLLEQASKKVEDSSVSTMKQTIAEVKSLFQREAIEPVIEEAKEHYENSSTLGTRDQKQLEKRLKAKADQEIEKTFGNYEIETRVINQELGKALERAAETGEDASAIIEHFEKRKEENQQKLNDSLASVLGRLQEETATEFVKTVETKVAETEKKKLETDIRDHLRGFSRTIPSFLMAYGSDDVTLATFDQIIPDEVFQEVTSISLDEFRFLRDGGPYVDEETGETKVFAGNLFDPVVFDDSVKEFLNLKARLANYFDESNTEDIFDYVPPQRTNQIFTPKKVVKQMVDYLEEENPGCFDDSSKTFMDLYMKSGLYITEIVTRLFNSEALIKEFPDEEERLGHIFSKQVYGLAPTEIIYRIATNFILGFSDDVDISQHNFRKLDALPFAKNGTLSEELDKLYGTQPDTQERKVVKVRIRRAN